MRDPLRCVHCRTQRVILPLGTMIAYEMQNREPFLLGPLLELRMHVGEDTPVSFCPGCGCLTSDVDHTTH
jgi:hypothetical protein